MQQLGSMAEDLLEERVRNGTASPTESVALLKLNDPIAIANLERIRAQTEYLQAQKKKAESETFREEKFDEAMAAMKRYAGDE